MAVGVAISPWLLVCTALLALLLGFGKRRHELVTLSNAVAHRRNLDDYTLGLLDQAVATTAAGTLIAYAVYTIVGDAVPRNYSMMTTIPVVAYGVYRYLYVLYRRGQGGAPEQLVFADRPLFAAIVVWGLLSSAVFYGTR